MWSPKGFCDFKRYRCCDTNCGRRGVNYSQLLFHCENGKQPHVSVSVSSDTILPFYHIVFALKTVFLNLIINLFPYCVICKVEQNWYLIFNHSYPLAVLGCENMIQKSSLQYRNYKHSIKRYKKKMWWRVGSVRKIEPFQSQENQLEL